MSVSGDSVANGARGFEAIHFGHGEIEQDQVGFGFFDVLDGLQTGGGFQQTSRPG